MAEAIVGPLMGKLQDLALSKAKALAAVNGDIQSLRDKLMWLQAFLRQADQQRRNTYNELIRVWIKQTRDAAFDAEDAIDLFILKVDLSRERSWTQSMIRFLAGFTTQVSIRHNLSIKIAEINSRLEGIMNNKEKYMTEQDSSLVLWRPSVIISTVTTKMDDVQAPLVQRTFRSAEVFATRVQNTGPSSECLYVTGEGGVGKATLVREVYESPKTQTIFEERVWASFPPYLSVSNILQLIYQQLEVGNTWCCGEEVEQKIKEKLEGKKFLLVIDGEISNSDWMALLHALPKFDSDKGCKVVRIMQALQPTKEFRRPAEVTEGDWWVHFEIPVPLFCQDETTEFFVKWVAKEANPEENSMFAARLHNMTGGLPLAVVLLCGLLRHKEYPNEWEKVLDHMESNKSNQSKRLDIILTMCFDDLPHDIKSCFLYFAVLPMNTHIESHKLVCMWMAEGFLRPKDGKTKEKLGRIYLKDLVSRNLVKVVKKDSFSGHQFVAVHHKVHAFLQLEAQEANFVEIHNGDDSPPLTNARRLSLQNYTDKYAALANPLPKLRSILSTFQEDKLVDNKKKREDKGETTSAEGILGSGMLRHCWGLAGAILQNRRTNRHKHIKRMLQESRFLRVINLQGVEVGKELPATIRNVPHLQYLGVTACSMEMIPQEIGLLKDLQTLDVRDTKVSVLPQEFWEIKTLRHVFGSGLILPKRVGKLQYLQTLETIQPDETYGWNEKTFKTMVNLQSLYICDSSDKEANVKAVCEVNLLEYLEKMVLKVGNKTKIPCEVVTSRSQRRLRAMALCGKLDALEDKQLCVPNLAFLSLKRTKVSQDFISTVGELPLLASLILEEESYADKQLVFGDGKFRSLRKLTLSDLKKLKKLVIGENALAELTDLVIMSYKKGFNIQVDTMREFLKKIEGEDKDLFKCIHPKSVPQKQSDQPEAGKLASYCPGWICKS